MKRLDPRVACSSSNSVLLTRVTGPPYSLRETERRVVSSLPRLRESPPTAVHGGRVDSRANGKPLAALGSESGQGGVFQRLEGRP